VAHGAASVGSAEADEPLVSTWEVVDGTQVHHEGVTYGPGETFDAADEAVAPWQAAGWVAPASTAESKLVKPRPSKRKAP
jgi:hypothetical protein